MDDEDDDGESAMPSTRNQPVFPKEKQEEITEEESKSYITKWEKERGVDKEKFKEYILEVMKARKWTYRNCIENFEVNPEHTKGLFQKWALKK